MSNFDDFFGGGSQGLASMPSNVGASQKRNGSGFPAGKLIDIQGITRASTVATVTIGNVSLPLDTNGLTRSGSTATFKSTGHGILVGATGTITVSGADQSEYNITATFTRVDANNLSYTVSGTPTTPATGTIVGSAVVNLITTSLTQTGGIATFESTGHGLIVGSRGIITVSGAVETDYNVSAPFLVIDDDNLTYPVLNNPTSPATGTIVGINSISISTIGTLWLSGVIETDYNGTHDYTLITATTLTYTVSGSPSTPATGVFSAAVNTFEGDSFRLPNHAKIGPTAATTNSEIKRLDKTETEVWSVNPYTAVDDAETQDTDDYLGITMDNEGNFVFMTFDTATTDVIFTSIDKTTGATLKSIVSASTSSNYWPGLGDTDTENISMEINVFDFSTASSDLTRTSIEVLANGNYLVIGQAYNAGAGSVATRTSAIVEVNSTTGAIISNNQLTH